MTAAGPVTAAVARCDTQTTAPGAPTAAVTSRGTQTTAPGAVDVGVTSLGTVDVVLPAGVDDPSRPSGGNRYDRRLCEELAQLGWTVREHLVTDPALLTRTLPTSRGVAAPAVVLIDGMLASAAGEAVAALARARPVVVLVHMLFAPGTQELRESERLALTAATVVVVTSEWSRGRVLAEYRLDPCHVHVAPPGADRPPSSAPARPRVDHSPLTPERPRVDRPPSSAPTRPRVDHSGTRLLCVAAVARGKGHDVLVGALQRLAASPRTAGVPWRVRCVGSLTVEPSFVAEQQDRIAASGLRDLVRCTGAVDEASLEEEYATADLLVLPSRGETWGMVVTEAVARGVPVLASDVGGIPEALGAAPDGCRPGILVPSEDPAALAAALGAWLTDSALRQRLRAAAVARGAALAGWGDTAQRVTGALVAAMERHGGCER